MIEIHCRQINAGDYTFVFYTCESIYMVVASCTGESPMMLQKQLNLLYHQIVSILTSAFHKILQKKKTYDLRNLLGGQCVLQFQSDATELLSIY